MSGWKVPDSDHVDHPLFGCQLKIVRAQEHFDTLQDSMRDFMERDPYGVIQEYDAEFDQHVIRVEIRERPPPQWSPIIGDIVHNLRSSLDHLAWRLVLQNGRNPYERTQFPIFTKDPIDPSAHASAGKHKSARRRWEDRTRGMHPNDVATLKELQPYQRAENPDRHPLAVLNQLSNWDKHRELHFATSALAGPLFYLREGSRNVAIQPVQVRPSGHVFEDGAEVARFEAILYGPDPRVDVKTEVMLEIAFGEGSPLEGLWINQTLSEIGLYVSDVILDFKSRFDEQP